MLMGKRGQRVTHPGVNRELEEEAGFILSTLAPWPSLLAIMLDKVGDHKCFLNSLVKGAGSQIGAHAQSPSRSESFPGWLSPALCFGLSLQGLRTQGL